MQRSKLLFVIAALLLSGLVPILGQAHAKLTATQPADGDLVAAPDRLSLEFDGALHLTGIAIVSVSGERQELANLPEAAGTRFDLDIPGRLSPGEYYVVWKGTAADSHFSTGEFFFTITGD